MVLEKTRNFINLIFNLSFCLIFTFPVLPNALQSIFFGLFLSSSALKATYNFTPNNINFSKLKSLMVLIGYYVLYLFSYIISLDGIQSGFNISPSILLILAPPVLIFSSFSIPLFYKRLSIGLLTLSNMALIVFIVCHWAEGLELSYSFFSKILDFKNYGEVHVLEFIFTHPSDYITSLVEWGFIMTTKFEN